MSHRCFYCGGPNGRNSWCPDHGDEARLKAKAEYKESYEKLLKADNERLRGLIKAVQTSGNLESITPTCPWCYVKSKRQGDGIRHDPACPAFTPDGKVK